MKMKYIMTMALGGVALVGMVGCEQKEQQGVMAAQQMPPIQVSVMNMHRQDVDLESTWFGHLRGVDEAKIKP